MEKPIILTADLLDILFEHRNKLYGAYELRRTYHKRIAWAIGGMSVIVLLFVGSTLFGNNKNAEVHADFVKDVVLATIETPPPVEPPPPPKPPEPQPVETNRLTDLIIVPDDQVKPEDEMKEIEAFEESKIGTANIEGTKDPEIVAPPVETVSVAEPLKAKKDIDESFTPVMISAEFPGGVSSWLKYLERNLDKDLPTQNGAPPGKYTVIVSFEVDQNGALSNIKAENDPGYGTKAEAIRVLKKSPNWKPAIQNGRNVTFRHKQSITFQVEEQ